MVKSAEACASQCEADPGCAGFSVPLDVAAGLPCRLHGNKGGAYTYTSVSVGHRSRSRSRSAAATPTLTPTPGGEGEGEICPAWTPGWMGYVRVTPEVATHYGLSVLTRADGRMRFVGESRESSREWRKEL